MDRAAGRGATEVTTQPADATQPAAPAVLPIPTGGSPIVLILFSDTGGGHRAAARALTDALKLLDPTCVVTVADPLIGQGPTVVRRLASLYSPMIRRSRAAWGAVYHTSNTRPAFAAIRAIFGHGVRKSVIELLQKHDPDVVLSVHPLLNHISHQAIRKSGRPRALMTVITDLVDFHRGWTFSQADLVIAPTELARKVALRRRVPADRIKLLGLPVDLRFRPPAPGEKHALRRRFGLDEGRFTVLVMGGAAGVGHLIQQVRTLAWEPYQWQLVVVCGRNEKLRRRMTELRFATPTLILGFVDYMPELGAFAPKDTDLFDEVRVLAEGGPTWREMARKAAELAHPYASSDIARECLLLAARYKASAQASR